MNSNNRSYVVVVVIVLIVIAVIIAIITGIIFVSKNYMDDGKGAREELFEIT